MLVYQAFRYELAPTVAQRAALGNHAGAARWAWNWALGVRRKAWQRRGETLAAVELHRLVVRLERTQRKLRRRARSVSRTQRGSRNRRKAALGLARLHRRIRNQRADALHKATTALARAKSVIVVEDPHVAGMVRDRHLARAISDQGWSEFHRQLTYKCGWYGSRLLVAPRFYPSSKTCAGCGFLKAALPLGFRVFRCEACGLVIDRDLNAARNLARLAEAGLVAGSSPETRNACGEGSADLAVTGLAELPLVKQERTRIRTLADA